jgi:hypothetical protein
VRDASCRKDVEDGGEDWGLLRAVVNVVSGVVTMANSDGQSKRGERVTRSETGISG